MLHPSFNQYCNLLCLSTGHSVQLGHSKNYMLLLCIKLLIRWKIPKKIICTLGKKINWYLRSRDQCVLNNSYLVGCQCYWRFIYRLWGTMFTSPVRLSSYTIAYIWTSSNKTAYIKASVHRGRRFNTWQRQGWRNLREPYRSRLVLISFDVGGGVRPRTIHCVHFCYWFMYGLWCTLCT